MEAGGDRAAVCESAGGMNGDVLKTAKVMQELKVYKCQEQIQAGNEMVAPHHYRGGVLEQPIQ